MTEYELNSSLKLLAKSSVIILFFVIISKLLTYFYRIVIARNFGPEIYGVYSLAFIIISLVASLASLGLSEGLLRYLSLYRKEEDLKKAKYLLNLTLVVSFFMSILVSLSLFFLSEYISLNIFKEEKLVIFLGFFSLTIPLVVFSGIFLSVLKANEKIITYSFIVNILQNGIKFITLIILIYFQISFSSIIYSYIFSAIVLFIISYKTSESYILKIFKSPPLNNNEKKILENDFFEYSWPIMFLSLTGMLFYWTDSFVIGYFQGVEYLGFYNVAFTIVGLLGIGPELFMQLFFPLIMGEYSKNNISIIKDLSKQVEKWILIINIPIFILIFLFPGSFINILFGQEFLAGEEPLRILCIGSIAASIFIPLSNNLLSMKGKSRLILYNLILISIFNFIANILLVPTLGLNGAAISTTISWIILSMILIFQIKRHLLFIPIKKDMIKIFFISLLPTLLLVLIKDYMKSDYYKIILAGIIFLAFYTILIIYSKCLDKNDLMIVNALKNKIFRDTLKKEIK